MYRIERRFTVPIGHRLSKHKGRCKNIHGHNFTILVGVKTETLDDNDMVMDFSDLKVLANEEVDRFDHCLMINKEDSELSHDLTKLRMCERVIEVPFDPTAERLAEYIYKQLERKLDSRSPSVYIDYVTVYENENSKATYCEE